MFCRVRSTASSANSSTMMAAASRITLAMGELLGMRQVGICPVVFFLGAMECLSALQEGGSNVARGCCQHDLALGPDLGEYEVDEVRLASGTRSIEKHDVLVVIVVIVLIPNNFEECIIYLALVVGEVILEIFSSDSQFFLFVLQLSFKPLNIYFFWCRETINWQWLTTN